MLDIGDDSSRIMSQVQFEGPETTVVWTAREFFVLHRPGASRSTTADASDVGEIADPGLLAMLPIGTRVEGRRDSQAPWRVYTVVGRIATKQHPERPSTCQREEVMARQISLKDHTTRSTLVIN